MNIDDYIRDEKLQYDVNGQAENISALSSDKIKISCIIKIMILTKSHYSLYF